MSASKHRIYFLLQRAAHRLKTEADAALSDAGGLTTAQAAMMSIVEREGPVTQKHIATTLLQRESAITTMAARLLKAGYITKVKSDADARAWSLEATAEGRTALENMRAPFDRINAKLDTLFSEADITELAERLTQIIDSFSEDDL
ncbi:MAG: MarR family winged helix-turn-helix transcriptional regulator [Pseudomonadota bacterium]